MKKKLYVAVTSILLVIAFAIASFATFSDMVTVQYVKGYNAGRQIGVPTTVKKTDSKTVQFYATSITSWTKPQTCLAQYNREGTTASDMVTLYNGQYIPANASSEKGLSYNVKIYGSPLQSGTDSMRYMYDVQ